jgi:endonuclease/exonuclease/phosphatase family metal-dependent hydrolase
MVKLLIRLAKFSTYIRIATFIALGCLLLAYLCPFIHPTNFWILPFFGLAYPVIISIVFLFLGYWAIIKSRMVFIVLITIALGGKLHFRTLSLPIGLSNKEDSIPTLKITSYNVRLFDLYEWGEDGKYVNRNAIFNYLQNQESDVFCFQEFYHQDKPTKFPTRDTLKQLLNTPYCHERYSHKLNGRKNFGIAMLSKYPIITKGDIMFEDPENIDNNYCIFSDIVKDNDTFRIYNVHLQSIKFKKDDYSVFNNLQHLPQKKKSTIQLLIEKLKVAYPKRAEQAKKVVEHMNDSPYPVIICGDFNDTPLSYTYNKFASSYTDAFRNSSSGLGITYAGKVPAGRIDYIFHSKVLNSSNFTIQKGVFSDHRAIGCEVWKKPN